MDENVDLYLLEICGKRKLLGLEKIQQIVDKIQHIQKRLLIAQSKQKVMLIIKEEN